MKKLIMMALAGFMWKKFQARTLPQGSSTPTRRY